MSQIIDKSDTSGNSSSYASAAEKVFQIDELREAILRYAIYNSERKLSGKMIKSVRLVERSWLQTTSKLLRKAQEPAIELTVDRNGFLDNSKDKKATGKVLNELVERFGGPPKLQESFLPLKLEFNLDFFRERNYQGLSDILTRLGSYLVELKLEYPKSGGTMPAIFPPFGLPLLQKLTFQFSDDQLKKDGNENANAFGDNRNGLMLLQLILNASNGIKNLIIPFTEFNDVVPVEFKFIQLPATITFLDMSIKLKSKDLEVLLRNQLPSLSQLTLLLPEVPFEDGLLFKILERFQNTIEILHIDGIWSTGKPRPPTMLRLPLLPKLKEIRNFSLKCELGPENVLELQKLLPKLTSVYLIDQTEARLAKWTENSRFENVEKLTVAVVNEQLNWKHESFYISPSFQILNQLHRSFPNVCRMTISFDVSDLTSLKHLFQHFVQLKTLRILFSGNDAVLASSSDLIDSIFLGLPLRLVATLKEEMQLLDAGLIVINGGSEPSIRNLSELVNLTLRTDNKYDATLEVGMSLISNLLFRHAFMKMTKLRNLFLYQKFQPTSEMEEEWKRQGRYMKYFAD